MKIQALFGLAFFCAITCASSADDPLKKSAVKIFTVVKKADYGQPWLMGPQSSSSGSGCVLPGRRILTNAHVVSDQVFVQVMKAGDTKKYTAQVEFVGHDLECAFLSVEDPAFFEGTTAVIFGDVPDQRDKVAAYGFPIGGNDLSITEGVVSRVESQFYVHSQNFLLAVQTDAAINPGNSGGPVFKNGRLIGISFQSFSGSGVENTGYCVPIPVIRHFLDDIADKNYEGVPGLGIQWEKMENESLRARYGVRPGASGVLITQVLFGTSADGILREDDVLTSVDGIRVANDGTVPFRGKERVSFSHLVTMHQLGAESRIGVWRAGKDLTLRVKYKKSPLLVDRPVYGKLPTYYILGGLVFTPLSYNYMAAGNNLVEFRYLYENGSPSTEQRQIVVLNQVLPHEINVGYHDFKNLIVAKVNGRPVTDMEGLVRAFQSPVDGFHIVETDGETDSARRIVLSAADADKATPGLLGRFGIPLDRSADLK